MKWDYPLSYESFSVKEDFMKRKVYRIDDKDFYLCTISFSHVIDFLSDIPDEFLPLRKIEVEVIYE